MSNIRDDDTSVMGEITSLVKDEGFVEGSDAFEKRKRQLKIQKCRELHLVTTCQECIFNEDCPLYLQVKLDHYGSKSGQ